MDSAKKAELKRAYREIRHRAGVLQLTNRKNGKRLIRSSPDVDALMTRLRFELNMGGNIFYDGLQKDWNADGEDSFAFEILELVDKIEEKSEAEVSRELSTLETLYCEQFQPYGEKGYNRKPIT